MNKKSNVTSIEEITKNELSAIENVDKIAKLEKDLARNKKIIEGYKDREKTSARALVLYERKVRYLKETLIKDILDICNKVDKTKYNYEGKCNNILDSSLRESLLSYHEDLSAFQNDLYEVCNKLEANSTITKQDRDFISDAKISKSEQKPSENLSDADSRFERLKQEFEQKIGGSVLRGRGRPKKSEQSIVSTIGLTKRVEKSVDENQKVKHKLEGIFYETPKNKGITSDIPQTSDSIFDFNEALNPNISLKDIMSEIMTEKPEEEVKVYGSNVEFNKFKEEQKKSKVELIESGYIRNPVFRTRPAHTSVVDSTEKKPTFERRFLSIQNIIKENKD